MMRSTTAEQMKWFLRIILKDLKLGMSMHRILAAFHPQGREYYDNCSNLVEVTLIILPYCDKAEETTVISFSCTYVSIYLYIPYLKIISRNKRFDEHFTLGMCVVYLLRWSRTVSG